jgi:hypothetical protein
LYVRRSKPPSDRNSPITDLVSLSFSPTPKTGLFAVTVTAFIIESYKRLSPDYAATTALLLNQISQQLSAQSGAVQIPPPPPYNDSSFRPTPTAIRVNILWFLSLTLSLICALAATLMQQWARRYMQLAEQQSTVHKRARTRSYLHGGVQAFGLSQVVEAVPALLHVAVFLFFAGLIDFLFSIDRTVGRVILAVLCVFGCIYIMLTFLPNVRPNCPYRTPFSRDSFKWFLVLLTAPALLGIGSFRLVILHDTFERISKDFQRFLNSLRSTVDTAIESQEEDIEKTALKWTVATIDDDEDIETLVEGIPGYIAAGTSKNALSITKDLLQPHTQQTTQQTTQQFTSLGHCINRLIVTCTSEGYRGAAENFRKRRALICLHTTRFLTDVYFVSFSYGMFGDQTWPSVNSLKRDEDPVIAIGAICTGALAACAYLRHFFPDAGQTQEPVASHVQKLLELVDAPWPENKSCSYIGSHLLILHGFVVELLPHLRENVAPTSFHAVWETLPRILKKVPRGPDPLESDIRKSFLSIWEELGTLVVPEQHTLTLIDPSEPPRSNKAVVQLMSMLRPTVESLRAEDAAQENESI